MRHKLVKVRQGTRPVRDVQILDHIDGVMTQGGMVYLHCWGGVGRTGTIVACWLARHGYRGQAAVDRLGELWSQRAKVQKVRAILGEN